MRTFNRMASKTVVVTGAAHGSVPCTCVSAARAAERRAVVHTTRAERGKREGARGRMGACTPCETVGAWPLSRCRGPAAQPAATGLFGKHELLTGLCSCARRLTVGIGAPLTSIDARVVQRCFGCSIAKATATLMAREGARVVLADRDAQTGAEVAAALVCPTTTTNAPPPPHHPPPPPHSHSCRVVLRVHLAAAH